MTELTTLATTRVFGGTQTRFRHSSTSCNAPMTATVFVPDGVERPPVVLWLSGLTCTDENFMQKAGAQRVAAMLGIALVAPDTSPRDLGFDGEDDNWDFGSGAGFYVNATRAPWSAHYQMFDYVTKELPQVVTKGFGLSERWAISGHSMGGHGALVAALRNPEQFVSASAFAPIANPTQCGWGHKAFNGYLGHDESTWQQYDTVCLLEAAQQVPPMLVDQGSSDEFLSEYLHFDALVAAAEAYPQQITATLRDGYDHSYYFIATFIEAHLRFHHQHLVSGA
ncbi:MAG: S-formylglutathione hydrolase [Gammaproteobacteria bacterium]